MLEQGIGERVVSTGTGPGNRQNVVRISHNRGRLIANKLFDVPNIVSFEIKPAALGGAPIGTGGHGADGVDAADMRLV